MPINSTDDLVKMAGLEKAKTGPKSKSTTKKKAKKKTTPPAKLGTDGSGQYTAQLTRAHKTNKQRTKDISIALEKEGYDPIRSVLEMLETSQDGTITDLEKVKVNMQLLPYLYQKQKSVEVKEEKDYRIEVINKNFAIDPETDEVIEV